MDRVALLNEVLSQNPNDAFARYGACVVTYRLNLRTAKAAVADPIPISNINSCIPAVFGNSFDSVEVSLSGAAGFVAS
jgi:hypothetical protein